MTDINFYIFVRLLRFGDANFLLAKTNCLKVFYLSLFFASNMFHCLHIFYNVGQEFLVEFEIPGQLF